MTGDMPKPPETVTLKWCPVCGRDDRLVHLRTLHRPSVDYVGERIKGGFCPGEPVELTYMLRDGAR